MNNTRAFLSALLLTTVSFSAVAQLQDSTICEGETVILDGGAFGVTWDWSTGETTQTIEVSTAGEYSVEVFDGEVTNNDTMDLTVLAAPAPVKGDTMVCSGDIITLNPGSYSAYLWSNGWDEQTLEFPFLFDTNVDITVTAANGCTLQDTIYVQASQAMELELDSGTTSCYGEASGWASVAVASGGIGPFTYLWGNDMTTDTIEWVPAQAYSIEVTDAAGCQAIEDVLVEEGPDGPLSAGMTSSDAVCNGPHGTATVVASLGTAPYKYLWEGGQTTSVATALLPGVHAVTVSDYWDCKVSESVIVSNENESMDITVTTTNSSCEMANGGAQTLITGGYTPYVYAWDNGSTTADISGILAGFHAVTVTDSLGCVDTGLGSVSDDEAPGIVSDSTIASVCSQQDGALYLSTIGGTAPLTYSWSNGSANEDLVNVGPGKYQIQITDANNCVAAAELTIATDGVTAPKLGGTLRSSLNDSLIKHAKITIIQNLQVAGVLPTFVSTQANDQGQFEFDDVIVGEYILFVTPDTSEYEASFKTFYPNVSRWNQATAVTAACEDSTAVDVSVIQKFVLNGKARITGTITEQIKGEFNKTQGDPIPGIDVSLEQLPGGVVAQTNTDEDGIYLFDNVPPGTYGIHVDIPGLPMDSTYEVTIPVSQEDTLVAELDFLVDSTQSVYIEPVTDAVYELPQQVAGFEVYPNPVNGVMNLAYRLADGAAIQLSVYDATGRLISSVLSADQQPGQYRYTVDLQNNRNGLYFVHMSVNGMAHSYPVLLAR